MRTIFECISLKLRSQAKNVADKKRADIDERRQMAIALHNANERLDESVVHLEYLDEMIRIIGNKMSIMVQIECFSPNVYTI